MESSSSSSPRKRPRRSTVQEGQDQVVLVSPNASGSTSSCQLSPHGHRSNGDRQKLVDLTDESDAPVEEDPKYYYPEADCAIRVEDTLFRVHRFLLARDSSAFQDMFDLSPRGSPGQDKNCVEGYDDCNPIVLHGESAQNFRSLLSVLYALPAELHTYSTDQADISSLLSICTVANKYHFTSTESWAVSCLYSVLGGGEECLQQYVPKYCTSSMLSRVLEVAVLCGHDLLQDLIEEVWVERLWGGQLDPLKALRTADAHSLRTLYGVASYLLLLRLNEKLHYALPIHGNYDGEVDVDDTNEEIATLPKPQLTSLEQNRLLSGHLSLIHLWDRLRSNPPKFDRPDGCTYHQHGCLSYWEHAWDEVARSPLTLDVSKHPTIDVVGKLESMKAQLDGSDTLQCALTPGCRRRALESVKRLTQETIGELAEHFVGVA